MFNWAVAVCSCFAFLCIFSLILHLCINNLSFSAPSGKTFFISDASRMPETIFVFQFAPPSITFRIIHLSTSPFHQSVPEGAALCKSEKCSFVIMILLFEHLNIVVWKCLARSSPAYLGKDS